MARPNILRHVPALVALAAGAAVLLWLVLRVGLGPIAEAAGALGWRGFLAIIGFHLCLIVAMGFAWRQLGPGQAAPRAFVYGRWVRDSAAEALPLSQLGGFVIGARALTLGGASGIFAAASTLVDLSIEACAKLPYTLLGVVLLQFQRAEGAVWIGAVGVVAVALPALGVVLAQGHAARLTGRAVAAVARRTGRAWSVEPEAMRHELGTIWRRRAGLARACAIHFGCWLASGLELWITLRLMGSELGLVPAIIIDSLLNGLRTLAFAIPGALGVQEAGYVALGALFALPPDMAIALSLLRRGRDLAIGIPGVLSWQAIEGNRLRRLLARPDRPV